MNGIVTNTQESENPTEMLEALLEQLNKKREQDKGKRKEQDKRKGGAGFWIFVKE